MEDSEKSKLLSITESMRAMPGIEDLAFHMLWQGKFPFPSKKEIEESSRNRLLDYRSEMVEILKTKGLNELLSIKECLVKLKGENHKALDNYELTKRINSIDMLINSYVLL